MGRACPAPFPPGEEAVPSSSGRLSAVFCSLCVAVLVLTAWAPPPGLSNTLEMVFDRQEIILHLTSNIKAF